MNGGHLLNCKTIQKANYVPIGALVYSLDQKKPHIGGTHDLKYILTT